MIHDVVFRWFFLGLKQVQYDTTDQTELQTQTSSLVAVQTHANHAAFKLAVRRPAAPEAARLAADPAQALRDTATALPP